MNFSLHTYIQTLRDNGASSAFIASIRRLATPLISARLPVLLTLGHFAYASRVPYKVLMGIVSRAVDSYFVFSIRKRNGGRRYICVPEPQLLLAQRWIHRNILCEFYVLNSISNNATAYLPGSSHVANAERHCGASLIVKLDITRFFESISERQVYHAFRSFGYSTLLSFSFARLCTRCLPRTVDQRYLQESKRWLAGRLYTHMSAAILGHLPQGAPTSPMLSNLVCRKLDADLQKIADGFNLTYTRYADDMTFSGDLLEAASLANLISRVSVAVGNFGFRINSRKTSVSRRGGRMIVTGLSVNESVLHIPRSYKDKIRQELYYLKKFGIDEHCARIAKRNHLAYLRRLSGKIHYVTSVEPIVGSKMRAKFDYMFPGFQEIEAIFAKSSY